MEYYIRWSIYLCIAALVTCGSISCKPIRAIDKYSEDTYIITTATTDLTNRFKQRGYILAGVQFDSPPFGFINAEGEVTGFEIDLLHEFARRWLGGDMAVSFMRVTSGDRIDRLLNGDVDLIVATLTQTSERDERIDFSQVYYLDGQNILVNQDLFEVQESDVANIKTLDMKRMAVVEGTTSIISVKSFARSNGIAIILNSFEQYDQTIQPLLEGSVDGLTGERGILIGLAQQHHNLHILLDQNFTEEPYAIGLPPGDQALVDLVNETLQQMKQDGTYDHIYSRWFPGQTPFLISTD